MIFFRTSIDSMFKKNRLGDEVFYPYGIFGPGYIIESNEKKNEIKKFLINSQLIGLLLLIPLVFYIEFYIILYIFLFYLWFFKKMIQILAGLKKSEEQLKYMEFIQNFTKASSYKALVAILLFNMSILVLGAWILLSDREGFTAGIILSTLAMPGLIIYAYFIYIKKSNK